MFGLLRISDNSQAPVMSSADPCPPVRSMAAPPPGQFRSREELLEFMKDWAETQGYAVVIGRSRPNKVWIKCDRGGKYSDRHAEHPENRKRKRIESRLTGCPFKIQANTKKDGIWRSRTETAEHNHGPSEDLSIHPTLRRMTDEQNQKVNEMTEGGHTPVEILAEMQRLWPNIKLLRRDIYNARKKYKTEKEVADMQQGLHLPQPYQDPSSIMPGPTRTGKWVWLEEGDEIKKAKKTKKSINLQLESDLDIMPEPRTHLFQPLSLPTPPTQPSTFPDSLSPNPQHATQPLSSHPIPPAHPPSSQDSPPPPLRNVSTSTSTSTSTRPPPPPPQEAPQPPPHLPPETTTTTTTTPNSPETNSAKAATSNLVLMSRIERMDKELRDQKNMLAQILGAVKAGGGIVG